MKVVAYGHWPTGLSVLNNFGRFSCISAYVSGTIRHVTVLHANYKIRVNPTGKTASDVLYCPFVKLQLDFSWYSHFKSSVNTVLRTVRVGGLYPNHAFVPISDHILEQIKAPLCNILSFWLRHSVDQSIINQNMFVRGLNFWI